MMTMNPAAYGQSTSTPTSFPPQYQSLQQQQHHQQQQQHGFPPGTPHQTPIQNVLHQQQQHHHQQQQQHHQQQYPGGQQPLPYTSAAPFSQSMSPSAVMPVSQGAMPSPSHRVSPYGAASVGQGSPQQSPHPPQSPPSSTSSAIQEKERITLLLEINVELLHEMHRLQAQGKGGALSAEAAAHLRKQGLPDTLASDEYTQVYLRLHSNLGYVCGQTDHLTKPGTKQPHPPSYVTAPPSMPQLEEKFGRLRGLFPGWTGRDGQRRSMSNGVNNAPTPTQG